MRRYNVKNKEMADKIIAHEYANKTAYTVALIAGSVFSPGYISNRAHQLGYKPYKKNVQWTAYDAKYIQENYKKTTPRQLADMFDVDITTLKNYMRKLGILGRQERKKKRHNLIKLLGDANDIYTAGLASSWGCDVYRAENNG